mmetsp:Transcript_70903/g.168199  ORF Transcript_70903/g.168199 Transcript_70903/m.168199 type:complete len:271 (-) Transcript_70903:26-838(-)
MSVSLLSTLPARVSTSTIARQQVLSSPPGVTMGAVGTQVLHTRRTPSLRNTRLSTSPAPPGQSMTVCAGNPAHAFHTITRPSCPPVASRAPSAEKHMATMGVLCPETGQPPAVSVPWSVACDSVAAEFGNSACWTTAAAQCSFPRSARTPRSSSAAWCRAASRRCSRRCLSAWFATVSWFAASSCALGGAAALATTSRCSATTCAFTDARRLSSWRSSTQTVLTRPRAVTNSSVRAGSWSRYNWRGMAGAVAVEQLPAEPGPARDEESVL